MCLFARDYNTSIRFGGTGEVADWQGHPPEQLKAMKENLERLKQLGIEAIEDQTNTGKSI